MFDLPEKITIWNKGKNSGFGESSWDGPYVADARIAYKTDKLTDLNGDDFTSTAVCYSEHPKLNAKSRVFFGDSREIEPPDSAKDVRQISSTPSGTGLRKAWF